MRQFQLYLLIAAMLLLTACQPSSSEKQIGIIVPIEVKALDEIVKGFETSLQSQTNVPLKFKVANAQGDMNMERAIIQQMATDKYAMVVPIGTDATEMAAAAIKNKPIVSLASSISEQQRKALQPCNMVVVHDEIPVAQSLTFIHAAYPNLKKIALIHSASDKIFPQVNEAITAGKKYHIEVKAMMATTLNDLYSVANNIPTDADAIFVLKDTLIVNGITTLQIAANNRHIPLYTSDQGSVQDGAGFALGVHESAIGEDGGKLAAEILGGRASCTIPNVAMTNLTVFVNKDALAKANQDLTPIETAAKKLNYPIEIYPGAL